MSAIYSFPLATAQVTRDLSQVSPLYDGLRSPEFAETIETSILSIGPLSEKYIFTLLNEPESADKYEFFLREKERRTKSGSFENSHVSLDLYSGLFGTNSKSTPLPEMGASINPLLERQTGRWQENGIHSWLEFDLQARFRKWGAFHLVPRFEGARTWEGGDWNAEPELHAFYGKLGYGDLELRAGRIPVLWGNGRSGGFILSNSNRPLDAVEVRNSVPTQLPWIFSYLGDIQFSILGARLSESQIFPHSTMVAQKIVLRPSPWVQLGYAQAVILGGEGSPDLSASGALIEVLGRRKGDINQVNYSNRNFLFDAKLTIPSWNSFSIFTEVFLEDCCGGDWLRDISNMVGFRAPGLFHRKLSLGGEWLRTTEITFRNGTFRTGFADRNHTLGHPIGPDAMGIYLYGDYFWTADRIFSTEVRWERRGRNEKTQRGRDFALLNPAFEETENRYAFISKFLITDFAPIWIRSQLGFEYVENFFFENGKNQSNFLGMLELGWSL